MKKPLIIYSLCMVCFIMSIHSAVGQTNEYLERFLQLREKVNNPANGYFSPDGVPYHSVETLIVEAPDYGHETVSETYSYWLWMEALYGRIEGDWQPLNAAWQNMDDNIIPTTDLQPTAGNYNPNSPATYAAEFPLPSYYPAPLQSGIPVGQDPVSSELTSAYGNRVYGMHWILDSDNFYGYGNKGDGVSTPSYINTFQRGEEESVWETIPHPSWEEFDFGGQYGYLDLFTEESQAPAKQWKYTNAPDADARAVQVMYWAYLWAEEQGLNPETTLPLADASKMGDFLRLAMFDKYFKPLGVESASAPGATGYESAHYLMSWYYSWGGPVSTSQNWAWRIGCSHSHFGYQNPVAAYALSEFDPLKPITPNGARDWSTSLDRQLEFYQWLQSDEGGIAGGATNSWNGDYSPYPAGATTFYDMAYTESPVYNDPGSNTWFGWQAWSMERLAEYYYIVDDPRAATVMEKWVDWVLSVVELSGGSYQLPATLEWSGAPNTWNPANPMPNTGLHVSVVDYTQDVGVAGCLAKTLTYYAAATEKWGTLDTDAQNLAKELLDRVWDNYWEEDGIGVSNLESRGDYDRFFEQEVYVPAGWSGEMPNGDDIEPGIEFLDIRSDYRNDPDFPALEAAYNSGTDYTTKYHRFWAQVDVATANAIYGLFFGEGTDVNHAPDAVATADVLSGDAPLLVSFDGSESSDPDGDPITFAWDFADGSVATGATATHEFTTPGSYDVTLTVTDSAGLSDEATLTIEVGSPGNDAPTAAFTASPTSGEAPLTVAVDASASSDPDSDPLTYSWDFGDGTSGSGVTATKTYSTPGTYTITLTVSDGEFSDTATEDIVVEDAPDLACDSPTAITMPFSQDGSGEYCWVVSGNINYINSWNTTLVEINGVDYTNTWSNSFPAAIDGKYYIHYESSVAWSHFEINGTSAAARMASPDENSSMDKISIFPNPAKDRFYLKGTNPDAEIMVMDLSGKITAQFISKGENRLEIGTSGFHKGMYLVRVIDGGKVTTLPIVIE
ncbi:glycoside hydrolase family 48 protein [Fulvivirga sediminis]|uniref:PKD domain-containing protein n=1 Tax=Fulvivirga sediminis TaxID=2803949 RepID=A0A937F2K6_9BACT|nr:glycoside hydrolase family 48 protein [Fulvivirga sediminis]MBL3655142.1 PKD domain-containing protein [Fulvivirga sediminis]